VTAGGAPSTPAVGDEAPDFALRDQHGQTVQLSSYRGVKPVLLVFFPPAFSPVCSSELTDLASSALVRPDVELLTVSCDPMFTLRAFSDLEKIQFPMLTDFWPHGRASAAYGVFDDDLGCSKRSTFLVDDTGRVAWVVHNAMPDAREIDDYVTALDTLSIR
jgi:mycoredoxin-dependent peroxiredoxin